MPDTNRWTLIRKRKNSSSESTSAFSSPSSTSTLPLTKANLALHNTAHGLCPPIEIPKKINEMASEDEESVGTPKKTGTAASVSSASNQFENSLAICHVMLQPVPTSEVPQAIVEVLETVCPPEDACLPPDYASTKVAQRAPHLSQASELRLTNAIMPFIFPPEKIAPEEPEGLHEVSCGVNDQWTIVLPLGKEHKAQNSKSLSKGKGNIYKPPSRPKPDAAWGYHSRIFTYTEWGELGFVPADAKVFEKDPHWPWLVLEMKPRKMRHVAVNQALRDAAGANEAYYNVIEYWSQAPPPANESCVFSMIMDAETVELRCHWREKISNEPWWQHTQFFKATW